MSLKAGNNRYLDRVELFTKIAGTDELGYPIDDIQSVGEFDANVEQMNGSRALYFQSQGYTHPIVVRMYNPLCDIAEISWNGSVAAVKSVTPDKNNTDCVVIYADLIKETP